MSRNILVLWRWKQALDAEGENVTSSVGGQMKAIKPGDRLFICATNADELYLLGLLAVKTVKKETDKKTSEMFGKYCAEGKCRSGKFKLLPLGSRKSKLRFLQSTSDRIDPGVKLAHQVRMHRFLSDDTALLLEEMLGQETVENEQELRFVEGERRAYLTMRSTRSASLRIEAKKKHGTACYCCGFDFEECYGDLGHNFAIIHHLNPLAGAKVESLKTSVDEVCVVCANCHAMVHQKNPPIKINELKKNIEKKWTRWSKSGVKRN